MFVLDTNVLSAIRGSQPVPEVAAWVAAQPEERLFTTTVCQAEILAGVEIMPEGRRRRGLGRPRYVVNNAKTPVLNAGEARVLFRPSRPAFGYSRSPRRIPWRNARAGPGSSRFTILARPTRICSRTPSIIAFAKPRGKYP